MIGHDRRVHRASASRILLLLEAQGKLDGSAQWTRDRLDALPGWSLLDHENFVILQRLCGAVFLAPLLRLMIDGRKLQALRLALGASHLDDILNSTSIEPGDKLSSHETASLARWMDASDGHGVDGCLLDVGANVLCASIEDTALRIEFIRVLVVQNTQRRQIERDRILPCSVASEVIRVATGLVLVETPGASVGSTIPAGEAECLPALAEAS